MDKILHIVSLDVPYPVNYGGLFDLFYKLEAMSQAGVRIHLHCFAHQKVHQQELRKYCEQVFYYERKKGLKGFSLTLPYIVSSRISNELIERLLQNDHPIILEGIHSCYLLMDKRFFNRKIIVRLHNVEFRYYGQLFRHASWGIAKFYYLYESRLLKKMEAFVAERASLIIAVTDRDMLIYRQLFKAKNIVHLPVFTGFKEVRAKEGVGCYCLYHGNLSVPENEKAATWLLRKVFKGITIPFLIAGKNPSDRLIREVKRYPNASLMANPGEEDMNDIIAKAQLHILPSFNTTGIKLKLLNALYNGRHCIVNDAAVEGTGFESACHIAGNANGFKSIIAQLYNRPFTDEEIRLRERLLSTVFNNQENAKRLIQWIW
ncbi:MAG: glycosyltransferase [Flavitalea sp.]